MVQAPGTLAIITKFIGCSIMQLSHGFHWCLQVSFGRAHAATATHLTEVHLGWSSVPRHSEIEASLDQAGPTR